MDRPKPRQRHSNKDVERLLKAAERAGATIKRGAHGTGHFKVRGPGGQIVVASSPSRPALDRIRRDLTKRAGLRI